MTGPARGVRVVARVARPPLRAWLGLSVSGALPESGPVVVASTHTSHADAVALGVATQRPLTFLGSDHLPAVLRALGMLPVTRGAADRGALDRCLGVLGDGGALVVFPEGGRSRDGRVYRPRSGVARLATAAGCPVVPAGVTGTVAVWPPGAPPRMRRGAVHVAFGAPLDAPAPGPAARRAFADELHAALVALSGAPAADQLLARYP